MSKVSACLVHVSCALPQRSAERSSHASSASLLGSAKLAHMAQPHCLAWRSLIARRDAAHVLARPHRLAQRGPHAGAAASRGTAQLICWQSLPVRLSSARTLVQLSVARRSIRAGTASPARPPRVARRSSHAGMASPHDWAQRTRWHSLLAWRGAAHMLAWPHLTTGRSALAGIASLHGAAQLIHWHWPHHTARRSALAGIASLHGTARLTHWHGFITRLVAAPSLARPPQLSFSAAASQRGCFSARLSARLSFSAAVFQRGCFSARLSARLSLSVAAPQPAARRSMPAGTVSLLGAAQPTYWHGPA